MQVHNEKIAVFSAGEHNLKNIDISISQNKLVAFIGISGSGKSSLALDIIYNGSSVAIRTTSMYEPSE